MPMSVEFSELWNNFCNELKTLNKGLGAELKAACEDLDTLIQTLTREFELEDDIFLQKDKLESFTKFLEGRGAQLLFEPLRSLRKIRPQERY
jgi:hypothetical protein